MVAAAVGWSVGHFIFLVEEVVGCLVGCWSVSVGLIEMDMLVSEAAWLRLQEGRDRRVWMGFKE